MTDKTTPDPLLERITHAADGLFIMSETDSPLTPFRWADFFAAEGVDKDVVGALRQHQKMGPEVVAETVTLKKFFKTQIEPQEGDDAEIAEEKRRLAELRDLLATELQDVAVHRFGEINIPAYVLGRVPDSRDAAGFSTELVET